MVSEGKTPFAPRVPESRASGSHRLRRDEGLLAVSDRAVDPGQQRPSPRWGVAGASCNARSGCAEARVRDVLGVYSSLGEQAGAAAREQRSAMGRPSRTNSAAVGREHASATARPPGNAGWQEQGCTMGCLSVLDNAAAASQGVMGAGGTRTCAGRVGRRVSQGGGVPSKWNPDEEMVAWATGRLTNWYPQVSKALGVASQENAAMPKKSGMSAWADQAHKKLT